VTGKVRLWKCVVCGEVFPGVYPPETCAACGASFEMFVALDNVEEAPKTDFQGHIVVLGAGAAAISAVKAARASAPQAEITVIAEEPVLPTLPYFRPSISDYLSDPAILTKDSFWLQPAAWYQQNNITLRLQGEKIRAINPQARTVQVGASTVHYDKLVYALGAFNCAPPPVEPLLRGANSMTLRTLEDFKRLRTVVTAGGVKKALLMGGGILNLEVASELLSLGVGVTVLEVMPRMLPRQLDAAGSRALVRAMQAKGLVLHTGAQLEGVTMDGPRVKEVRVKVPEQPAPATIDADIFIVSCGVKSATDLAKSAGLAVNRGVVVDKRMATSDPNIFACGDCAEHLGLVIPSWNNAMTQGAVAGKALLGLDASFERQPTPILMDAFDVKVISVGDAGSALPNPTQYTTLERDEPQNSIFRKLFFVGGKLVGAIVIAPGEANVIHALTSAVAEGMPLGRAARLLLD